MLVDAPGIVAVILKQIALPDQYGNILQLLSQSTEIKQILPVWHRPRNLIPYFMAIFMKKKITEVLLISRVICGLGTNQWPDLGFTY